METSCFTIFIKDAKSCQMLSLDHGKNYTSHINLTFDVARNVGRAQVTLNWIWITNSWKVKIRVTLRLTASRSVCLGVCHPFGAPWPYFNFSFLLPENCFALRLEASFLTKGRVCILWRNMSMVGVAEDSQPYITVSSEITGFSFRLLLRLAGITVEVFLPASTRGIPVKKLSPALVDTKQIT
jgi:hypothetical protein